MQTNKSKPSALPAELTAPRPQNHPKHTCRSARGRVCAAGPFHRHWKSSAPPQSPHGASVRDLNPGSSAGCSTTPGKLPFLGC